MIVPGSERGFTLVEMLAVLAIIGVAGGAVAIGLGSGGGSARGEAERLAAAISLASDEALVMDAPVRLVGDARGWTIEGAAAPVGGRRELAEGVELEPGLEPVVLGEGAGTAEIGVAAGEDRWTVRFDGLSAVAVAEGG